MLYEKTELQLFFGSLKKKKYTVKYAAKKHFRHKIVNFYMYHEMNRGCNCRHIECVKKNYPSTFLLISLYNHSLKLMSLMLNCFIKLFLNDP
jgi:hypothetical protein